MWDQISTQVLKIGAERTFLTTALCVSFFVTTTPALAETSPRPRPTSASTCNRACEADALADKFNAFNYLNEQDLFKGYALISKAIDYADVAERRLEGRQVDMAEFAAFVRLVAASDIYDMETSMADVLSGLVYRSGALRAAYQNQLPQIEKCRRDHLTNTVEQYLCRRRAGATQESTGRSCVRIPTVDFEDCLRANRR